MQALRKLVLNPGVPELRPSRGEKCSPLQQTWPTPRIEGLQVLQMLQIYPNLSNSECLQESLQSPLICPQKNPQNIQSGVSEERSRGKRSRDRRSRDRRSRDRRRSRDKRSRDRDRRRSRHVSQSALCGQSRPRNDTYLNILRNQIGWLFGLKIYYPGFA